MPPKYVCMSAIYGKYWLNYADFADIADFQVKPIEEIKKL
jgi:hypothetical protein